MRTAKQTSGKKVKSRWLQAAVLGSNDGIISIAGLVIGVFEATQSKVAILTAGLTGIVAGALSLAAGEYVAVSAERDTENALLSKEKKDLIAHPAEELADLESAYESDGVDPKTAEVVAEELTKADAFEAHADVDFNIDSNNLTNPWISVVASSLAFVFGAAIPLVAIMMSAGDYAVQVTFVAVVMALTITGYLSAKVSGSSIVRSTMRVVAGGVIAMVATYLIGGAFRMAGV